MASGRRPGAAQPGRLVVVSRAFRAADLTLWSHVGIVQQQANVRGELCGAMLSKAHRNVWVNRRNFPDIGFPLSRRRWLFQTKRDGRQDVLGFAGDASASKGAP